MEFLEKAKDYLSKGAKASKEAFDKAGNKLQDFSDQSVIKLEIRKCQNDIENISKKLGDFAVKAFLEEGKTELSASDETVADLLQKIKDNNKRIEEMQEELKKFQ
ncbi:MAG: hypothetical protein MJ176_01130 [Treponema sp.]|nr:hypothetical protein [Treponema sp.]